MTKKNEIYKCNMCGNVVEIIHAGAGELVCCGKPMELMEEKTGKQEGKEKHVPVVKVDGKCIRIDVGSVPHPMEDEHYIGLIEILGDGEVIASAKLNPGEKPEADFCFDPKNAKITARIWCNVHGVWKS